VVRACLEGRAPAPEAEARYLVLVRAGSGEIYVRPFPDVDANQVRISNNTGRDPLWSRDGRELFYLDEGSPPRLVSVSFEADPATGSFAVAGCTVVMDWPYLVSGEGREVRLPLTAPPGG